MSCTAQTPAQFMAIEVERRAKTEKERLRNKIASYYPDEGPLRRELYPKHIAFFAATKEHNEVCFMGGNRTGKTIAGTYSVAVHLTGQYPEWWPGRRFSGPTDWWVAGDTNQTTRDILQAELMGRMVRQPGDTSNEAMGIGTGMIPADKIKHWTPKSGMPNAIEMAWLKHVSGGTSSLGFKSYDQGRESFSGTAKHGILVDEECPEDVYLEALLRTMTVDGMVLLTFTPLSGVTPVVRRFMPEFEVAA